MEAFGKVQRSRQWRSLLRFLIMAVGIIAIAVLLYLIGNLPPA